MADTGAKFVVVIPARFDSQRLPGKVLLPIGDKPMLEWVWNCARKSAAAEVVIATDHEEIFRSAKRFGATVFMTRSDHNSGSDRIAECARHCQWSEEQIIVNLQGDEPQMPGACLDQLAQLLAADHEAAVASLYWPIENAQQLSDPNIVKVVCSAQNDALYFSRAAIPYDRAHDGQPFDSNSQQTDHNDWFRHLGVYAYRNRSLQQFTQWPASRLEQIEKLEQLRFLEQGQRIRMAKACEFIPAGVDHSDDLERVCRELMGGEP